MYRRRLCLSLLLFGALACAQNEVAVKVTGALFGAQGRFRLVIPKDKPGARSVRMLTTLEVVQLRK